MDADEKAVQGRRIEMRRPLRVAAMLSVVAAILYYLPRVLRYFFSY